MKHRFIDSSEVKKLLAGNDCSPDEEKEIVAQYMQKRLAENMKADYPDLESMLATGIPAEQVLKALKNETPLP